jgi:hypothetical protein
MTLMKTRIMPEPDTYMVPQSIGVALMSGRGCLLRGLGVPHAKEILDNTTPESMAEILRLISDLIDDRFKLRVKAERLAHFVVDIKDRLGEEDEEFDELLAELT